MKYVMWILAIVIIIGGGYYWLKDSTQEIPMNTQEQNIPVTVIPIQHASGVLDWGDAVIYFDPTGGSEAFVERPSPTIVLITDIHGDHFSTSTIEAVLGNAALVVPKAVYDLLPASQQSRATVINNSETKIISGFSVTGIPMYNLPDADNAERHTPGRGNGYVIEKDGFRVYLAGDTAGTPEMRVMQDIDIAFVPMNLPYTMGVEEAADAVLAFKPKIVYPYHYRQPDGFADVEQFKQLVESANPDIRVILDAWY